uniref:Variant surface glycoprotein 1125.1638 n=1 Tax=Trypanosoma brucei TaxID=5691 RepID=A0A1J0R7M2_9TRYP|nr:variant surface glycoprotein 1125.1638 [Trypanosoma brucei]
MLKKRFLILVAAAALLATNHSGDAVSAGDNTHLFIDLCALITLPTRQLPELPSAETGKQAFQEIMKLNNSLSDETWRKKFAKAETEKKERAKYQAQGGKVDTLHQQRWDLWTEAEEELDKERGAKTTEQAAGLNGITPEDRTQLLVMLQPLAEEAATTYSELRSQLTSESAITKAKLQQRLAAAAYGEGVNQLSDLNDDKLTGGTAASTTRAAYCGQNTPTETKATSISGLLYCICAGERDDASGNFKACTNEQSGAQAATAAMTNAAADVKALAGLCPPPPGAEVTATDILEPLAAFLGKGTAKEKYVVFGTLTATSCGRSSNDGLCVIYKTETKEDAKKLRQALCGHLPGLIKASLSAAMLAEQISETTEMFFKARTNTGTGQAYCTSEDHSGARHATASHIPNCVIGSNVQLNYGDAEVTAAPDLTSLAAEIPGKGSAATLGANRNGNCHLSATVKIHGILNHANGNEATLYLAGGLLKIAGTAYDNNAWSTQHDKQPNSAITETRSRYATVTSALPNTLDTLKKLAKLGEDTDPQIDDTKVQSTDLGLSGEAKEITTKKTVFSNLHKEIKQFLTKTQTEKNKERQTVARDMLVKALTKPSEPLKCDTSVTDDVCYPIKEETACNATAACSYNKTETDSNKKCKLDAEKAKKKSVSATQPQTTGTETPTDKGKDKKMDDCESPDCKWEGENCKDPSFLLKSEFAVITAVFMS